MKQVICSERLPIKMWLNDIEPEALQQAKNLANLPFAFKHIAIMPDSHSGYGMPIGGVLATKGVIVPNAVGVDIGCGMLAIKTGIKDIEKGELESIVAKIKDEIPVGYKHRSKVDLDLMPNSPLEHSAFPLIVEQEFESARTQLGTLGGGNHFIELQRDLQGELWIMMHSGSRNLGKKVADYYNTIAKKLNATWCSSIPQNFDLAFLPVDSDEGHSYINEMNYCISFAKRNRAYMGDIISNIVSDTLGINEDGFMRYDISHNYARMENHFGQNVMVHRKGAISAKSGERGIIPGSQGTKSYITLGLGNEDSFTSCSHGAGRALGRKKAIATLDLREQINLMDSRGVIHSIKDAKDLDEAPGAYKNIDEVMKNQNDLVEIITELSPIAVIKG
jgi:tRNA-splicing ligase RtcB